MTARTLVKLGQPEGQCTRGPEMNRAFVILIAIVIYCGLTQSESVRAQGTRFVEPSILAPLAGPGTASTYYQEQTAPNRETLVTPPEVIYGPTSGSAPLIPTIAEGIRNTINCLFPCRDGLALGLGNRSMRPPLGSRLFSVRFYEGCGCGIPIPSCGCGIEFIEGVPTQPTPVEVIPDVNPPKPIPDPSAYYRGRALPVPVAYRPGQQRGLPQARFSTSTPDPVRNASSQFPPVIQTKYYPSSAIPNPLRP